MYTDIVTIFNHFEDKKKEIDMWYPTVLYGVELQVTKGINISKTGNDNADSASLHIKINEDIHNAYKKPNSYKTLEDKREYFTLKPGDFFMEGEYSSNPIDEADYPNGFFEHMKSAHDDVYNITTVDTFKVIPHFEIGGE